MSRVRNAIARHAADICVGIVEDHAIVRAGVRMLIEKEQGIEVVWEAPNATCALAFAGHHHLDMILLDLSLRGENGIDFVPRFVREFSPAKLLIVTANEDIDMHLRAVEAGARGVVMKEQAPEILVEAIHAVHSGASWLGSALAVAAIDKLSRKHESRKEIGTEEAKISTLTAREKEVVEAVARGFNGSRIATELRISDATVRHHLTSILSKLDLSNKHELAVYAIHHGLSG